MLYLDVPEITFPTGTYFSVTRDSEPCGFVLVGQVLRWLSYSFRKELFEGTDRVYLFNFFLHRTIGRHFSWLTTRNTPCYSFSITPLLSVVAIDLREAYLILSYSASNSIAMQIVSRSLSCVPFAKNVHCPFNLCTSILFINGCYRNSEKTSQ